VQEVVAVHGGVSGQSWCRQSKRAAYSCCNQPPLGSTLSLATPASLDELLNYRLLRLFALGGAPVIRLLEGRYGIARREWRLLALLAARGPLAPSALADEAHLDRPRTSRAIATLSAKALVQRQPAPGDRRRARVLLTAAGERLYAEVFPQVAALNAELVQVLDATTQAALDRALSQLTERAAALNTQRVQDVHADRRAGGSRRVRAADAGAAGHDGVAVHDGASLPSKA
jgi:DNA-binding MarR family transcriptional regulator